MPGGYIGGGIVRVALGEGENSFEAIPEVPAGSTMGDQWDAEVPQFPQATCLVEVLKECEGAVAGEEIHQVAGDGGALHQRC
jgi:hypothetical protein